MRRALAVAGMAISVMTGGIGPPSAAQAANICVMASVSAVSGTVSHASGPFCVATPFPTRPLHVEHGLQPYVWVVVDVTYP